jgi:exopolysaccharide biosynthesis polyprenyl glycosylphosphotransferase
MIDRYFRQLKIILLGFDISSFVIAFFVANLIHPVWISGQQYIYLEAAFISLLIVLYVFQNYGLYRIPISFMRECFIIIKAIAIAFVIIAGLSFFYRYFSFSRLFYSYFVIIFLIFTLINRWVFRKLSVSVGNIKPIRRNTLIVGCGVGGTTLINALRSRPSVWQLTGYLDDHSSNGSYQKIPYLGRLSQLEEIVTNKEITDVFIAIPSAPRSLIQGLISKCESFNLNWRVIPNLYDLSMDDVHIDRLDDLPLVGPKTTNIIGINQLIKRSFDFAFSSLALIFVSPFMAVTAVTIKFTSPGPVLFRQTRIGLNGKHFTLLKFRSMFVNNDDKVHRDYVAKWIKDKDCYNKDSKDKTIFKIKHDPRITRVGYWLRKFSLDELPQLFNIWKGDMSLVGPRPPLPYEVEIYQNWQKKRLQAPPGLTGLWQVSGRNKISFEEMVRMDISYINNWSLETDIKILFKTVAAVLSSKGH